MFKIYVTKTVGLSGKSGTNAVVCISCIVLLLRYWGGMCGCGSSNGGISAKTKGNFIKIILLDVPTAQYDEVIRTFFDVR